MQCMFWDKSSLSAVEVLLLECKGGMLWVYRKENVMNEAIMKELIM